MPALPAALAAAGGIGGIAIRIGVALAVSKVSSKIAERKARSAISGSFGQEVNLSGDPNDVRYVVYGRAWTGGTLRYRNSAGTDNRDFYMVIVLAGTKIDGVEAVEADRELLTLDGSGNVTSPSKWAGLMNVRFLLGTDGQTADSTLDTLFANWTTDHRLRGSAIAIVKCSLDETNLNSLPAFRFRLRGRKVYQVRLDSTNGGVGSHRLNDPSTWQWTDNAIDCWNDYWRGIMVNGKRIAGPGVPSTRFRWPNVIAEANIADENVALAAGGTQKRYTVNGIIDPRMTHGEVQAMFEQAIAGDIAWSDNAWRAFCGAFRAPTLALGPDHFVGPLRHLVHRGERERRDTAHGRFSSLANAGTAVGYSPVSLAAAVVGSERVVQMDMQLVNDGTNSVGVYDGGARAQRIAKLALERDAAGKRLTATTNLYGYRATPGETIEVSHAAFGMVSQDMRVIDVELQPVQDGDKSGAVVALLLGAGPSSLYSWSAEETAIAAAPVLPQQVVTPLNVGWTPILVNVSRLGSTFTKTGGTNGAWDVSVYSQEGYNACAVSWRASQTNADFMVALNSDPATDHNYTSLDFGLQCTSGGALGIYESGVSIGAFGSYTTSDQLSITYDGVTVRYYKNAALLRSVVSVGQRLFLDSSFYTSGAAINSLSFGPISRADLISGNLLRTEAWVVGDVPVSRGNFNANETASDENQILNGVGPHGHSQLLWEGRCTDPGTGSGGDNNGGWDNAADLIGLDPKRTYRSTVWVRFTELANNYYHGCGGNSGETRDLDGTANTNPYFVSIILASYAGQLVPGKWYLSVGIIHGADYGTTSSGVSGLYDPETGQRVVAGRDFKMGAAATTQNHRTYMFYGGNTTTRMYWCEPRFEAVDGNEPPVSALLTAGAGLEWRREGMHDEMWYADAAQLHRSWTKRQGSLPDAEITLVTGLTDAPGGQAMRFGDNSGADGWWGAFTGWLIPYDPNYLYEVGVVVRRNAGAGVFWCGFEGVANDGVTWINSLGANNHGSQHYAAASSASPGASWTTYRGYVKGHSTSPVGLANDARVPTTMYSGVTFVRPLFIVNYNDVAGQMDVAAVWVRRLSGGLAGLDTDIYRQSSAPAHAVGRIWVDTDDARVYRSDGSTWVQISANDILVIGGAGDLAGLDTVDTPQIDLEAATEVGSATDSSTAASASNAVDEQYAAQVTLNVDSSTDVFECTVTGLATVTQTGTPNAPTASFNLQYNNGTGWVNFGSGYARPVPSGATPVAFTGSLTGIGFTGALPIALVVVAAESGGFGTVINTLTDACLVVTKVKR
jgi:hypothetical protein